MDLEDPITRQVSPIKRAPAPPAGWFRNLPIGLKLAGIVVAFVSVIAVLLVVVGMSLDVTTGMRAYVGGEGLWSKGQKDAVYYLARYARSHDERDYRKYLAAIAIPLGDGVARRELLKPQFDYALAVRGFVDGANDPADAPYMISLFRRFRSVSYMAQAIDIWTRAEAGALELVAAADELHGAVLAGTLSAQQEHEILGRIEAINARLTPLERDFSATLGEAARWIRQVLRAVIFLSAAVLLIGGLAVAWRISRLLRNDILNLRRAAARVAQGDLSKLVPVASRDELGELAGAFNEMIEHRRGAEDALRSANEFRLRVMESATNAIYAIDLEGRFTLFNRRTCEMTGYSAAELQGAEFAMLFPPEHLQAVGVQFDKVARGDGVTNVVGYETPLKRKDGRVITISFSTAPLVKRGRVVGVAGTAEDISERKRAGAELAARMQELARSNSELEQFAYAASHDLQEPLRTVNSFAQLLQRRPMARDDSEAAEFIGYITDAVARMRALIEGLLTYSRLTQQDGAGPEPVDLEQLLARVLADLEDAIARNGAHVTHDPLPVLPVHGQQIGQVLQNLISNALKFRNAARAPRVHVGAQRLPGQWQFTVRDNGIGIDPRHAERVFTLFQRLHTRDVYPGSGIGLAICKKIIETHGGSIRVEPAEPGSLFTFTLPDAPT